MSFDSDDYDMIKSYLYAIEMAIEKGLKGIAKEISKLKGGEKKNANRIKQ